LLGLQHFKKTNGESWMSAEVPAQTDRDSVLSTELPDLASAPNRKIKNFEPTQFIKIN
jgi:hypothetical protein